MSNISQADRLDLILKGDIKSRLHKNLVSVEDWPARQGEMPKPCQDVVTNEAFYCGLEGIGLDPELGWYLVLLEDCDNTSCSHEHSESVTLKVLYDNNEPSIHKYVTTKWHMKLLFAEHQERLQITIV